MNKDEYDYRRDWKLPKGFPNDPETVANKNKVFYGIKVHEAVIASGATKSGVTVHFVDEKYDNGKIIAQEKVEVRINDTPETLAERVLKVEHELYPKVVKAFCEDRILWKNNHPIIEVPIEN